MRFLTQFKGQAYGFALILIFAISAWALFELKHPGSNPDQWYHFAIFKQYVELGHIKTIPQVEDLGWNHFYMEKEFFFHYLGSFFWRLGSESGVNIFQFLLIAAILGVLFLLSCRYASWPKSTMIILLLALMTPYFTQRLFLLRPHLLAIVCFCVLLWGILERRPVLTTLSSALYCLSYHAFYIPLSIISIFSFTTLSWKVFYKDRVIWGGIIGILIGIFTNPYFPGNLILAFEHAQFATIFSSNVPGRQPGLELIPLPWVKFLTLFAAHLIIVAVSFYWAYFREKKLTAELRFLSGCALFLWALAMKSPRALEYAIPVTILATVIVSHQIRLTRPITLIMVSLIILFPVRSLVVEIVASKNIIHKEFTNSIMKAIATIPKSDEFKKVYNCDWVLGSFLLYQRPDLKFVDLLDPRLIYFIDKQKYFLIRDMNEGKIPDIHTNLKNVFHANYALCDLPTFNNTIKDDPDIKPMGNDNLLVHSFLIPEEFRQEWVMQWKIESMAIIPENKYWDFQKDKKIREGTECLSISVPYQEMIKHEGATTIVMGGGPNIQVLLNNIVIAKIDHTAGGPSSILQHTKIRLSAPLKTTDILSVNVCRDKRQHYWGLAMTLWKNNDLNDFCGQRAKTGTRPPIHCL